MKVHRIKRALDEALRQDRRTSAIAFTRAARRCFATILRPAIKAVRAARVLLYPSLAWRLHSLGYLRQFVDREACFFLSSEYYLSRHFSVWDRIHNALVHYEHELRTFDSAYRARVYGENGLFLWKQVSNGVEFSIRLVVSEGNGFEGDLSVILEVHGNEACRMSYTVVDGATFGLAPGPTLFVTRNQVRRTPELELFRRCFRNNSPQYFCLAAVVGIAAASGFANIAAVRGKAQGSYSSEFDEQFENSYCNLWQQFGGTAIDRQAWVLRVPLDLPPLSSVASKHRARASDRRAHWDAITSQASSAIRLHRLRRPAGAVGDRMWFHPMICVVSQVFCDLAVIV